MSLKMRRREALGLAVGLCLSPQALASIRQSAGTLSVPFEEFRLPNGLRVILHQDSSTPIVAVNLWYHVGSKNEVPGRTGFAHLFEHMMFQGSKNYDADYFTPLQEAGANINGSTNRDRTNYFEVVPSNFLELALFMEADRMGGLLEAMTLEKLNNQRDVVKNERRQNYDNQPYGTAFEKISAILYPREHPYHWTTIGSLTDLTAASLDDVKGFFRQYYVPNNVSLVIAGDFNKDQARKFVEKHFGPIPKGKNISRPTPTLPTLDKEVRVSYEDNVRLERLYMVWHTVPLYSADEAALDILGLVLSGGRGSRLQANLVFDKQIAQTVNAGQQGQEIAGTFNIQANARPNASLESIEREINSELERLKREPPTREEVERALNVTEARFILGLQTILGKANQLNDYATFLNKPGYFAEDLARYRRVTPQDVQRVAQKYLTDRRLVMSFVPYAQGIAPSVGISSENQPTSAEAGKTKAADASRLPKPGPTPQLALPPKEQHKLSNGLEVWLVRQTELPVVSLNLVVKTGATADPSGMAATASLTANMLTGGTRTRSALDIANQVQALGATLSSDANWDSSSVSLITLTRNLDKALDIFADVSLNPAFPRTELEQRRGRLLVTQLQRRVDANAMASFVYGGVLYGKSHPYGNSVGGDENTLRAITRGDLETFYGTYYRPNNAALVVVGDVTARDLLPKLERVFAGWKPANVPEVTIPAVAPRKKATIYLVDKPGAAQSVLNIGQIGVERTNPDYFPLVVMNTILGGQFTARVNMNLRENKGYTYGARTAWDFRRGAGPFTASAGVQTAVTKESVVEFLKELRGITGDIPVTPQELDYNKQSIIRRYPSSFETVGQISAQLTNLIVYSLPDSYFNDYISRINAVTIDDVQRVAKKYLDPSRMAILVVGDRKVVEPKLREIPDLDITFLDGDGKPI